MAGLKDELFSKPSVPLFEDADQGQPPVYTDDLDTYMKGNDLPQSGEANLDMRVALDHSGSEVAAQRESLVNQDLAAQKDLAEIWEHMGYGGSSQVGSDFALEPALAFGNPVIMNRTMNYVNLMSKVTGTIEKKWEEETGIELTLDGLDNLLIREGTLGMLERLSGRGERESDKINTMLNLPPEEAAVAIDEYLSELLQEGMLVPGENVFALLSVAKWAESPGYYPEVSQDRLLGVVEAGFWAAPLARTLAAGRAATRFKRWASMKGSESADEAAANTLKKDKVPDPDTLTDTTPGIATPEVKPEVVPNHANSSRIMRTNESVRLLMKELKDGFFGRSLVKEEVDSILASYSGNLSKNVSRSLLSTVPVRIDATTSNRVYNIVTTLGTRDGKHFATKAAASATLKKTFPEVVSSSQAKVVPAKDGKGFVIEITDQFSSGKGVSPLKSLIGQMNVIKQSVARNLGSVSQTDDTILNALAQQTEAGTNKASVIMKPLIGKIKKLNRTSYKALDQAFMSLRDDPKLRAGYTRDDLTQLLKDNFPENRVNPPSEAEIEALEAVIELEELGWFMAADARLGQYVASGYKAITSSLSERGRTLARIVENPRSDADVYVEGMDTPLRPDVLGDNVVVWRLRDPIELEDGTVIEYVGNPTKVDNLVHEDVLNWASGGRVMRPQARYFVGASGGTGRSAAFMNVVTEKQAKELADHLNAVRAKILAGADDAEINALILSNNKWNPNIETKQQFVRYFKKHRIDLSKEFDYKARDKAYSGELEGITDLGFVTFDDYIRDVMGRTDARLEDFGGTPSVDMSALDSMLRQSTSAAHQYVNSAYTVRSASSLARKMRQGGVKIDSTGISLDDDMSLALYAKIEGDTPIARELRHQQDIIRTRAAIPSAFTRKFEGFANEMREWVLDTRGVNTFGYGNRVVDKLTAFAFHSTLGLLNVDQLILQSAHSLVVVAMHPVLGTKALAMQPIVRASLNVSPEMRALMVKRTSKYFGMPEDELNEMIDFIHQSGRNMVTSDTIEHGSAAQMGFVPSSDDIVSFYGSRYGKEALDKGLYFFRQGELVSRYSSLMTAWMMFKKANPGKLSSLTDEGRRWIMTKDSALSFNMTNTQRSYIQTGIGKLPTQWLSYSRGAMEAVFIGRHLNKGERARLATGLVGLFGATGTGMDAFSPGASHEAANSMFETGSIPYKVVKKGLFDTLLSEATGVETAAAKRFSPLAGVVDLYGDFTEQHILETLGGPSVQIFSENVRHAYRAATRLVQRKPVLATEEFMSALKTVKSFDNTDKALAIVRHGTYFSKRGTRNMAEGLSTGEMLFNYLGIKPEKVAFGEDARNALYKYDTKLREFRKEMTSRLDKSVEYMKSDDPDTAKYGIKLMEETAELTEMLSHRFSVSDQQRLRTAVLNHNPRELYDVILKLHKAENDAFVRLYNEQRETN